METLWGNIMDIVTFCIFGLAIIAVVIFGRSFCGMVCPFGYIQSIIYKIPFKKIKSFKADKYLRLIKYIILFFIIISGILSFVGIIPVNSEEDGLPVYIWGIIIILSIIIQRPFCKYLCPVGAATSLGNKISLYKYHVDKELCIKCNKCTKICKMDIVPYKKQNVLECIRCGHCKKVCPCKVITTGFNVKKTSNINEDKIE
jgi:polyferredoxin